MRPGKWIYGEFLWPICDYFRLLRIKEIIFDWLIPIFLAFIIYKYFPLVPNLTNANNLIQPIEKLKDIAGLIINFVAILIGFTLAILTILITSAGENIVKLKSLECSERMLADKSVSLFQEMLNSLTFVVLVEFFVLLYNVAIIILFYAERAKGFANFFLFVDLIFLLHLIALNIRNVSNIYFVFWPEGKIEITHNNDDE